MARKRVVRKGIPIWAIALSVSALIVIIILVLAVNGVFRQNSVLRISANVPQDCNGRVAYSVELSNNNGGIQNQLVSVYANNVFLEKLRTDQNGRFSSSQEMKPEWCGKPLTLSALYDGSYTQQHTNSSSQLLVKISTTTTASAPTEVERGQSVEIAISLAQKQDSKQLSDKAISIIVNDKQMDVVHTNADGRATYVTKFNTLGQQTIRVTFSGDEQYATSESASIQINVKEMTCSDGTIVNSCSRQPGYFCGSKKRLEFDCSICGCASGLICYDNSGCGTY